VDVNNTVHRLQVALHQARHAGNVPLASTLSHAVAAIEHLQRTIRAYQHHHLRGWRAGNDDGNEQRRPG
jgi:hypothetical protein